MRTGYTKQNEKVGDPTFWDVEDPTSKVPFVQQLKLVKIVPHLFSLSGEN